MYPSSISQLGLFQGIVRNIHRVNPLICRGLGFLKNHRRGDQDFLVKMWGCSLYRGLSIEKQVSTAFHW